MNEVSQALNDLRSKACLALSKRVFLDTESTVLDLTTEIELSGLDLNFLESLLKVIPLASPRSGLLFLCRRLRC